MKTIKEIKAKIKEHSQNQAQSLMIQMCSGFHPLLFWDKTAFKEEYKDDVLPLIKEAVIKEMVEYLNFAFSKAYGKRGISSSRSIWKYRQWLWLIEDEELYNFASDDENYPMYGLPILEKIKEKYVKR